MKIVSWNVNSINARLEVFLKWLQDGDFDIICLQEIKCIDEAFPREMIEDCGYNVITNGQKTYNGVAILSKYPVDEVIKDFPNNPDENQKRYLEAVININGKIHRIVNVYVPNGQEIGSDKYEYKIAFFKALYDHSQILLTYDEPIIIVGDYNVAIEDIDVYNANTLNETICFGVEERSNFRRFLYNGYHDSFRIYQPDKQEFSWWDYRGGSFQKDHGMRIDYILVNIELVSKIIKVEHDRNIRQVEKTSDHAPVILTLQL